MTDEALVERIVAAARAPDETTATEIALLRAIASTRDEGRRAAMQRSAVDVLGTVTSVAASIIRAILL